MVGWCSTWSYNAQRLLTWHFRLFFFIFTGQSTDFHIICIASMEICFFCKQFHPFRCTQNLLKMLQWESVGKYRSVQTVAVLWRCLCSVWQMMMEIVFQLTLSHRFVCVWTSCWGDVRCESRLVFTIVRWVLCMCSVYSCLNVLYGFRI